MGDFGDGATGGRFYEKKGMIKVQIDGWLPLREPIKRQSKQKRLCEDTLTAIRRKLPKYYVGCRIDRLIDDDPKPMDVEPPEPEPPPATLPEQRPRAPPQRLVQELSDYDHKRLGHRHDQTRDQSYEELQALLGQRDDILKMIRDGAANHVYQRREFWTKILSTLTMTSKRAGLYCRSSGTIHVPAPRTPTRVYLSPNSFP